MMQLNNNATCSQVNSSHLSDAVQRKMAGFIRNAFTAYSKSKNRFGELDKAVIEFSKLRRSAKFCIIRWKYAST
jgi:hypothetical protein